MAYNWPALPRPERRKRKHLFIKIPDRWNE